MSGAPQLECVALAREVPSADAGVTVRVPTGVQVSVRPVELGPDGAALDVVVHGPAPEEVAELRYVLRRTAAGVVAVYEP